MIFVNHRINTLQALADVPRENGIELDIRYHEDELILHHDPFGHHRTAPTTFRDLLSALDHAGPMILNVKTEGVEQACIDLMNEFGIGSWFFLDLSMPYFAIYAEHAANSEIQGLKPDNLAVRFSEREPIEYALSFAGKAGWVWVDCFTHLPLDRRTALRFREAGLRMCIVSPELQKHDLARIGEFREQLAGIEVDAVCTKRPDLWGQDL